MSLKICFPPFKFMHYETFQPKQPDGFNDNRDRSKRDVG